MHILVMCGATSPTKPIIPVKHIDADIIIDVNTMEKKSYFFLHLHQMIVLFRPLRSRCQSHKNDI